MSKKGNCKKVRRMMVDIERHHSGHLGGDASQVNEVIGNLKEVE